MNNPALTYIFSSTLLLLVLVAFSPAQEKFRRVEQNPNKYQNYPLELVGCDIGNGVNANCSQIVGGANWWKKLTLSLKNVSSKTISQFNLELSIGKQGGLSTQLPIVLEPEKPFEEFVDVQGQRSFEYRRKVQPGETFKMTVVDSEFQEKSGLLKKLSVPEINDLSFVIQFIFFNDGTRWDFGRFSQLRSGQSSDISQKRINELLSGAGNEPIEITGLMANGKPVNINETFIADGEWLRDLTITFKNRSDRSIRWMSLYLVVLEIKPLGPPPGMSIEYGTPKTNGKKEIEKTTGLAPGENASVKIDAALFDELNKSLATREDISRRTIAELRIMTVTFADDTRWSWGKFYKMTGGRLTLDGDGSGKKPN